MMYADAKRPQLQPHHGEPVALYLSHEREGQCGSGTTDGEKHPLSPDFSPRLLRTHPVSPRSRDLKAALAHFSLLGGIHPTIYRT
jgi:hypothetical protein